MSERKTILSNVYWALLGKLVGLLCGLFSSIIVARFLGPERYGLLNYVVSYVFLFQVFALFGLDQIEIREEARGVRPYQEILGTAFIIKLGLGLLTVIGCIVTAILTEGDSYTVILIAIYSSSIIFTTIFVCRNYFMARVNNKSVVKTEITRSIVCLIIKIVLVIFNVEFIWFIVASLFDVILVAIGYLVSYRLHYGRIADWYFNSECAKLLLRESFPLLLTNVAVVVYQRIDQVMIGRMLNQESVGYFATASRFVEVVIYLPTIFNQVISPILVQTRGRSQSEYENKGQRFMNISIWSTFLASAAVALLAWPLVRFSFGERYLAAVPILQLLSFKGVACALSNSAGTMLLVEGLQKWAIFRDLSGCVFCVGCNFLLLPRYGVMAAAAVGILSHIMAGYVADLFIPAYRHIFHRQTKALLTGYKDVLLIRSIIFKN